MTPGEWVEWIREETLKRFEAGEMDEAIPTNRRVLIDAIAAAVQAEREAILIIYENDEPGISRAEFIAKVQDRNR